MQIGRQRWITRLVVSGVAVIGAWSLHSIVVPDNGPSHMSPSSSVACSTPSHLTMTYDCRPTGE